MFFLFFNLLYPETRTLSAAVVLLPIGNRSYILTCFFKYFGTGAARSCIVLVEPEPAPQRNMATAPTVPAPSLVQHKKANRLEF
jgi:hypothetical protein